MEYSKEYREKYPVYARLNAILESDKYASLLAPALFHRPLVLFSVTTFLFYYNARSLSENICLNCGSQLSPAIIGGLFQSYILVSADTRKEYREGFSFLERFSKAGTFIVKK